MRFAAYVVGLVLSSVANGQTADVGPFISEIIEGSSYNRVSVYTTPSVARDIPDPFLATSLADLWGLAHTPARAKFHTTRARIVICRRIAEDT